MGKVAGFVLSLIGGILGIISGSLMLLAMLVLLIILGYNFLLFLGIFQGLAFSGLSGIGMVCGILGFILIKVLNDKGTTTFNLGKLFGPIILAIGAIVSLLAVASFPVNLSVIFLFAGPSGGNSVLIGLPVTGLMGVMSIAAGVLLLIAGIMYLIIKIL